MNLKKKFLSIFVLVLSVGVIGVGGYYVTNALSESKVSSNVPVINQDEYYSIRKNATDLQVDLYSELSLAIKDNQSDEDIASLVAQNFVADFYTLTNKYSIGDIGGLQFVDETIRNSVYKQAKDTFYVGFLELFEADTINNALEVATIQVESQESITYDILGEEDEDGDQAVTSVDAVAIDLTWTYLDASGVDVDLYDQSARIILIKNSSGLFYVVEVNYE